MKSDTAEGREEMRGESLCLIQKQRTTSLGSKGENSRLLLILTFGLGLFTLYLQCSFLMINFMVEITKIPLCLGMLQINSFRF